MFEPPIPENEAERLASLCALDILDTPAEERFDRITRIARRLFDVPIALISLVDADRQWFKSSQGLPVSETPRNISFCGHAILGPDTFYVPDALHDPRFVDNPLVTGDPNIRFYAGAPLEVSAELRIGTLCIIDSRPRKLSAQDLDDLRQLADWAQDEVGMMRLGHASAIIQEQEARLRSILNNIQDGIVTVDIDGRIESANSSAERMFGYSGAQFFGQPFTNLLSAEHREEYQNYLTDYRATGVTRISGTRREAVGLHRSGSQFPIDISVSRIQFGKSELFGCVVRDISERKRVDQMKKEFVSVVSHELRTPLTSIRGSIGLLVGGAAGALPGKAGEMLDIALKNSDRLIALINDILDIERFESGKVSLKLTCEPVLPLIEQAIAANQPYAAKYEAIIALGATDADAHCDIDAARIMQVLSNLLSNAAKVSRPGGRIEVGMARRAGMMRITVTDQGPGIPKDFRDHVFEKFSQAESGDTRQKGGSGLGLAITRAIVEQHGGQVGFETESGKGTTFYFDLPMHVD